jgi:Prolyl oligopeptidase family/WD40-like Beta Propeller Repeat
MAHKYHTVMGNTAIAIAALLLQSTAMCPASVLRPLPIPMAAGEKLFPAYARLRVSPDGRYIAYTVLDEKRVDVGLPMNTENLFSPSGVVKIGFYANDIYVTDVRTGTTTNITAGRGSSFAPAWSSAGDRLVFISDRDGLARLWEWAPSAALRRISERPIVVSNSLDSATWVNGDKQILANTLPPGYTFTQENRIIMMAGHQSHRFVPNSSALVYDHMREPAGPSRETQRLEGYDGDSGVAVQDLSLIDTASGAARTLIQHFAGALQGIDSTNRYLAYTHEIGVDPKNFDLPLIDINVIDLASGKTAFRVHSVPASRYANTYWSPRSMKFAYFARRGTKSGMALYVADVASGTIRSLVPKMAAQEFGSGAAAWTSDGRSIVANVGSSVWLVDVDAGTIRQIVKGAANAIGTPFVITTRDGTTVWQPAGAPRSAFVQTVDPVTLHQGIETIDLQTGAIRTVRQGDMQYNSQLYPATFGASLNGATAAFVAWSASVPPDVYATADGFHTVRQLTRLNPELTQYTLGKQQVITWRTTDGHKVQGTLLLPAGYVKGKRYPTVVWQRAGISGPQLLDAWGLLGALGENWQILATRGYAVFMPDFPTNTAAAVTKLTKTSLLPALDRLVALGISKPHAFGITGESLGGETTMMITAMTNRFSAAVNTVGPDNAFNESMMFLPSGDAFRLQEGERWVGGTPWSNRAGYIAASAFFNLDKIHTPTLIMVSRGNWTDTLPQYFTDDGFVGLRRLNKTDVEYVLYEGGHGPFAFSYADRMDFWYRITAWFDKYLK